MNEQKNVVSRNRGRRGIGVGDRVQFRFGSAILMGMVVEDRGKIGMGGRRLLRIHFDIDGDQKTLELPEEELILM